MTQRAANGPTESDSTAGLLADWNIEPSADASVPAAFDPRPKPKIAATLAETTVHLPGTANDRLASDSLRFLHGFHLRDPAEADSAGRHVLGAVPDGDTIRPRDRLLGSAGSDPHRLGIEDRGTGTAAGGSRSSRELPGAGDVLAGFRVLHELGRGAFARVYLAEEIHLGGRLVAIKVSRAEGDEPRILGRLQHANIVPVHSVCDDRMSGLRVLCMPYFGGANLAQVLETAGGLSTTGRGGHSLVEALDRISQYRSSTAGEQPHSPTARRPLPSGRSSGVGSPPGSVPADELSRPAGLSASNGSILAFGFRSLLSRIIGGAPMPSARRIRPHPATIPTSRPASSSARRRPCGRPSGSSPGWPRASTTRIRGACSTAT